MSDETTLAPAPAEPTVDLTTKIEDPATTQPEPDTKPEPAEAAPEETGDLTKPDEGDEQPDGEKKNVPGSQKLKRRLQLIEQEFAATQQELETLRREREQAQQQRQQPSQGRPGIDREPTEQDFPNDYLAFERAKTTWDVQQAVERKLQGTIDQERSQREQRAQSERQREQRLAYEENADVARERIPDFDKVVNSATSVNVTTSVQEELLASEKSALLQYHLAKNPDKVRELNAMNALELAREIGRLEARIHLPTPKKATEASAPPSTVKGAASPPVDAHNGPDDMNAYVAWRRKQAS
jgi:hypothetical protein